MHAYIKQLHDEWYAKHKTPPHTAAEKSEYANDMLRIVGKLNIDSKVSYVCMHKHIHVYISHAMYVYMCVYGLGTGLTCTALLEC